MAVKTGLDLSELDNLLKPARTFQDCWVHNEPDMVRITIRNLAAAVRLLANMVEQLTLKGTNHA